MNHSNKFIKFLLHLIIKKQVNIILIFVGFIALKDLRRVAKELGELTDDNTLQ